jgi:hypothetical protein
MRPLVVLSTSVFTVIAIAQNAPATQPAAGEPATQLSRRQDSRYASGILDAAWEAQQDLQKKNRDGALKAIDHALDLQSKLEKSGAKGRLVPVYQETVSVAVYSPSKIAGEDRNSADRMSTPPSPVVQDVTGKSTRVFLNTKDTRTHLENAKRVIRAGDTTEGDVELGDVRSALLTETVVGDEPLGRARQNLMLAGDEAGRYLFDDTVNSLNATIKALEDYADAKGTHAADARMIARQILVYEQRMPKVPIQVAGQIQDWWDQVASWTAVPQPAIVEHVQQ